MSAQHMLLVMAIGWYVSCPATSPFMFMNTICNQTPCGGISLVHYTLRTRWYKRCGCSVDGMPKSQCG